MQPRSGPVRAPWANAIVERVMGTLHRERLDHRLSWNEQSLRRVLAEFGCFSNAERPHRALHVETPVGGAPAPLAAGGPIRSRAVLGGLHYVDSRAA